MPKMIEVDRLGKKYRLGGQEGRYSSLREDLVNAFVHPFRKSKRAGPDFIWALRNASFDIEQGDAVGIIGRNGAGKSTLLKLLARITRPTEGTARLYGRVGSLLEVGTGFHPELSGRENIFMSGAILGMRRSEVRRKFDEIASFAEIERFLDTPVKHYSSGMYVRLAFAVAAHLEPEVLLVDEVLAVGDASFQEKCLGKMGEVTGRGRTVLFVSHNMGAVNKLCRRGIWIDRGEIRMAGPVDEVVAAYIASGAELEGEQRWDGDAPGNELVRAAAIRVLDPEGRVTSVIDRRHDFFVEIEYRILSAVSNMQVGFWILSGDGVIIFVAGDREDREWIGKTRRPGLYVSRCRIPGQLLNAGPYLVSLGIDCPVGTTVALVHQALRFRVEQTQVPMHSSHGNWKPPGLLSLSLDWNIRKIEER